MTVDELIRNSKKDLEYGEKPHLVLVNLYSELFGFRKDIYGIIGKLIKVYGLETTFNAIIDLYDSEKSPTLDIYRQLAYYCIIRNREIAKRNLEIIPTNNLNIYLKEQ